MVTRTLKDLSNYIFLTEFDLDTMSKIIDKMKAVSKNRGHGSVTIIFVEGVVTEIDAFMKERINTEN